MSDTPNLRVVITGAPGSGKTTLIRTLSEMGYQTFSEVSRNLIEQGMVAPIQQPEPNPGQFLGMVVSLRIDQHWAWNGSKMTFYDRGLPDSLAFIKYMKKEVPDWLSDIIREHPYHNKVVFLPPWKKIFRHDNVRKEPFEETLLLHQLLLDAYSSLGYQILELPECPVKKRAELLLGLL